MSLFVSILVAIKVTLYLSSWFTSFFNDLLCVNSTLTFFSLNYWRFVTAPLATASLYDVSVVMTYMIIKILGPSEQKKGAGYAIVDYFVKSGFYVFVMSVFCGRFGPHEYYVCGLMPLWVADLFAELMQKPEEEVELFLFKVTQKNLTIAILLIYWIILFEPTSSIIAIVALAYCDPMKMLGEERVKYL